MGNICVLWESAAEFEIQNCARPEQLAGNVAMCAKHTQGPGFALQCVYMCVGG